MDMMFAARVRLVRHILSPLIMYSMPLIVPLYSVFFFFSLPVPDIAQHIRSVRSVSPRSDLSLPSFIPPFVRALLTRMFRVLPRTLSCSYALRVREVQTLQVLDP